jgi:serine/threonine-protein kinase
MSSANVSVGIAGAKVEELIRRYEDSWSAGKPLAIDVLLQDVDEDVRREALSRLSKIEAVHRATTGPAGTTGPAPSDQERRERQAEAETAVDQMISGTVELTEALPPPPEEQTTATASTRYIQLKFFKAGGLGELYQARDQALERDVALKFLGKAVLTNAFLRQKFEVEAIVTGGLDHPGVVPVYGLGETWDGRPFYAMRFIEGNELQDEIDRLHAEGLSRLGLHKLIGSLVAVCRTVAYAHSRGVIHRDIKPENVKIGKFGETILLDWGLAQTIQRDADSRARGLPSLVQGERKVSAGSDGGGGTIGYMSPEQLGDQPATPSPATDVYSLGATLYHILTGRPSIVGANCSTIRLRIVGGDFPKPSRICNKVPKALEAICLKAMSRDAADRYAGASELADDLEAWMADETVSCYREPVTERAVRHLRRHRVVAAAIVVTAATVIVGLVAFAGLAGSRAEQDRLARDEATKLLTAAENARADGMRVAARLAAKAVADDVRLRWEILQNRAADQELRRLMADAKAPVVLNGSPTQEALQTWLDKTTQGTPIVAKSWSLFNADGVQLARVSEDGSRDTVGTRFRYRDYFHGQGREFEPNSKEESEARPIREVYRSATYLSKAAGLGLTVTFSSPIWSNDEQVGDPLGVIAMSVSIGDYKFLLDDMNLGQTATLIDIRNDSIERNASNGESSDAAYSGLVLHHQKLKKSAARRVSEADVRKFRELRDEVLSDLEEEDSAQRKPKRESYRTDYIDPVANDEKIPVRAAIEPVIVRFRDGTVTDSAWVVVVHEVVGDSAPGQP